MDVITYLSTTHIDFNVDICLCVGGQGAGKEFMIFCHFLEVACVARNLMGLLPDTQNCGLRMRRNAGNVFPATDFKGNR